MKNKNSTLAGNNGNKKLIWNRNAIEQGAFAAAKAGEKILLEYFGKLKKVREKHLAGLVSEADEASEEAIKALLISTLPIKFLGEESSAQTGLQGLATDSCWIVDPLDGTTNYVYGFPIFCISIGLMWESELVFGLVSVPKLGLTYSATKGQGAFLNGQPLAVSQRKLLQEALLATGFFPEIPEVLNEQLGIFRELVFKARGIRRAGAAAFDLCLVAEGVFDAFWEKGLKPWDTAAGVVLVREAGGRVTDYLGAPFDVNGNSIIASNGFLHQTILNATKK
ncbi:MAG: inositol monophosphatase [Bdellovibrionales bacterium]|nr:inositol monophosphatase [Bdellovibrionales bacterium]